MDAFRKSIPVYYAGMLLVAAMTIGGGTVQGLWTDHILEIAMLPALFFGLRSLPAIRLGGSAKFLVLAILVLVLIQFVPIFRTSPLPDILPEAGGISFFSPAPQKSLEAALFTIAVIGFTLFVSRLSDADQQRCLRFLFLGFLINLVAGFIQLSYDQRVTVSGILPYSISAGLFANDNHFSSLIFLMIPLIAWRLLSESKNLVLYIVIAAVIVFFLFAIGSRAAMAISAAFAILSLFWFKSGQLPLGLRLAIFGGGMTLLLLIPLIYGFDDALADELRPVFFATTWRAIQDYWLLGAGLGSFTLVYPAYEAPSDIIDVFTNHAHNDFLELFLETGIAGVFLVGFYIQLILRHFRSSALAEAAALSVLALSLHSLVDYPLRTLALATVFGFLSAIILSSREEPAIRPTRPEKPARFEKPPRAS